MKNTISLLLLCWFSTSMAQTSPNFLAEKTSNSILIEDHTSIEILDVETFVYDKNYRMIIKNASASHHKDIALYYDSYETIKKAKVVLKDLEGKLIDQYRLVNFEDQAIGSSDFAIDGRIKRLTIAYDLYPFELTVSYQKEHQGTLHFPTWSPQKEKMRVLTADLTIKDHTKNNLRFLTHHVSAAEVSSNDKSKDYYWSIKNVAPFTYEAFNYNEEDYVPKIYIAPNKFVMSNYSGNMSSWKDFGQWIHLLNESRNDLLTGRLKELDQQIQAAKNERDKVAIIYQYVQNHTRYVSIQLGIGGWQPFKNSFVQQKKYGDCKALSFYTQSLLKHYGLKSYYTLIRAGKYASPVPANFPNAHFNHAILTVPLTADTLFLECTSQTSPCAYMGTFTANRKALMITEKGGELVNTTPYTVADNQQNTTTRIHLHPDGLADITHQGTFTGLEIENQGFWRNYQKTATEQQLWFTDQYKWDNTQIVDFQLHDFKDGAIPTAGFTVKVNSSKEALKMGKRLFLKPKKYIRSYLGKLPNTERKTPIRLPYGYQQNDTITYMIPTDYAIEKGLKEVNLSTPYGTYQRTVIVTEDAIVIYRTMVIQEGVYAKEAYPDFRDFVNTIVKADNGKIVLKQ